MGFVKNRLKGQKQQEIEDYTRKREVITKIEG
jgi:hypothetical protein